MSPFKVLVDTNVLMSPLTFCILIYLEELKFIEIHISSAIISEYNRHKIKIPTSSLRSYTEDYVSTYQINDNYDLYKTSSLNIKVKDRGDKHLIEFSTLHNIPYILTFDKNPFYKSVLRVLKIKLEHPDTFLYKIIKEENINLEILWSKLNFNLAEISNKLKNANLKKVSFL